MQDIFKKNYTVYILTNKSHTLYIGVTNNLKRRLFEHRNKLVEGFTKKYNIEKLIFYQIFENITEAIEYEKKIKGWTRRKKMQLIKTFNPDFIDLSTKI